MMGVQLFRERQLGPNKISVYHAVLNARPGEENAPPTDRFLFLEGRRPVPEDVLRAAIRQHHPEALAAGVEPEQRLWFLVTDQHEVIRTGRMPSVNSREAQSLLEAQFPGIRIGWITMNSAVQTADGDQVPLVWARLEQGSPLP